MCAKLGSGAITPSPLGDQQRCRRARRSGRATAGHDRSGAKPPALRGHLARGARGASTTPRTTSASAAASRCGTTIPAPPLEQLDGVRERRGDDRPAARDGVDEHAGGDLVVRVVRQDHEVGGADQPGQRRQVAIGVVERHRSRRPRSTSSAASASRGRPRRRSARTFGWVAPATRYDGRGRTSASSAIASMAHSMPLPGPRSPHVSRRSRSPGDAVAVHPLGVGRRRRRAVRDHRDPVGVDVEVLDEASTGVLGHDDDGVGGVADALEHQPLVRRRVARARCGRRRRTARRAPRARRARRRRRGRRRCRTRAARSPRRRRLSASTAASDPSRRRSPVEATTSGSSTSSASPQRTTSTVAPWAISPAASAAENVAMPHAVGGNVDRIPNERAAPRHHGPRGDDRPRRAPDVSSVEASSLRRATRPVRPSSPSEATLPRGCSRPPYRSAAGRVRVACGVPPTSQRGIARDLAPADRGPRAHRLAHAAAPLRPVGAVRLAARRRAGRRRPRRDAVRHRRLDHHRRRSAARPRTDGTRTTRSNRRSPRRCTSPTPSSTPPTSTSSTTASTSSR